MYNFSKLIGSKLLSRIVEAKKDKRKLLIYKSFIYSAFAQVLSVLVNFLLVPITIDYLDNDRYGVWLMLISVISWMHILDVGLGNGLRNNLAEAVAKGDIEKSRGLITSAYILLGLISVFILLLFGPLFYLVDWNKFLNIPNVRPAELLFTALILLSFFSFHFLLKLIGTIYLALQKPHVNQYLSLTISLLNLILVLVIKQKVEPSLIPIAIALGASQFVIYFCFTIYAFYKPLKLYRPSKRFFRKEFLTPLIHMGGKFFIIQVSGVVMFTTANFIISKFSEPASVVAYNLANRYLSVSNIVFAFILIPYWGAFTDAFVNKDYDWIDRELNQLRKIWYISILFIFTMIIFSSFFYKIWLEDKILIPFSVTLLTGVYFIAMNLSSIYYSLLNGIGLIDYNFKLAIVQLLCFYPLIMAFQLVLGNIIHSVLITMILNMIVSKVLLKRFYLNFRVIE